MFIFIGLYTNWPSGFFCFPLAVPCTYEGPERYSVCIFSRLKYLNKMKIQKLAIATIGGTVLLFLLDWVWYGMIMKDSMNMPGARPEPDFMWLVISYVIFSLAFVTIYSKWNGGGSKVNSGLNFGLWMGILGGLAMNLMWFSLMDVMTLGQSLTDSVYTIIKYILLGIVVAYLSSDSGGDRQGGGKTPG